MRAAEFISTLVMHFPVKHDSEAREMEWLKTLIQALSHYEGDVLTKAAKRIIDSRTDRRFPLPAEIRRVCAAITEEANLGKLPLQRGEKAPPWSAEREQLADDLCRHDRAMTRAAIEGGWILGLHNFVRREARMPAGSDIAALKREAARFDANYTKLLAGEMPVCQRELTQFAAAIVAKRADLAKRLTA